VPLEWNGRKLMLWLQNGTPVRLDLKRNEKRPIPLWPGVVTITKYRQAYWQKFLKGQESPHLELFLEHGKVSGTTK